MSVNESHKLYNTVQKFRLYRFTINTFLYTLKSINARPITAKDVWKMYNIVKNDFRPYTFALNTVLQVPISWCGTITDQ